VAKERGFAAFAPQFEHRPMRPSVLALPDAKPSFRERRARRFGEAVAALGIVVKPLGRDPAKQTARPRVIR